MFEHSYSAIFVRTVDDSVTRVYKIPITAANAADAFTRAQTELRELFADAPEEITDLNLVGVADETREGFYREGGFVQGPDLPDCE